MTKLKLLLRELRHANELSQEELARELSVSRQSIISLERGEYLPSTPVLLAMMEFFDCNIDSLFTGYEFKIRHMPDQLGEHSIQLTPRNTLKNLGHLQEEMSEMVEKTLGHPPELQGSNVGALNVHETENEYEIGLQIPGYSEDDINIEITNSSLSVSGEKNTEDRDIIHREWYDQGFSREIKFKNPIDDDNTRAKLENGILLITAPKAIQPKSKTKKIIISKK